MLFRISLLAGLIILFFAGSFLSQTTYYVSPDGNDGNNGLSELEAFATLQHASEIVSAGDSVLVFEGNFAGFDIRTNGTFTMPIVFKAIDGNVIIDRPNPVTSDGINIEDADWIVVDGFKVMNQPRAGIRIVLSDFVIIRNNYCTENHKWGIFTGFTDDITIENNTCSFSEDEHGIYVSNSGDRPVVRNNECFQNNGCGIQLNADASMGGDGIITNAVIEGNILHDNGYGGGAAINLDGVQESLICNNLLYNNYATGIALFRIDGAEGSKNNKVYNNTIVNPQNSRWAILAVNGSTGNTLYNNILINHHSFRGSIAIDESSVDNFLSDYNLLVNRLSADDGNSNMRLSEWQTLGYDLNSQLALPEEQIFINHSGSDYRLVENSQAIDKGTALVSPIIVDDLNKNLRPQGNGFDIGAYEYISPSSVAESPNVTGFNLYQNYPNPFNPVTKIKYTVSNVGTRHAVSLRIYDLLGREVATLVNEEKTAGEYKIVFSAKGGSASGGNAFSLASGVYFYILTAGEFKAIKKLMLLK